MATSNEPFQPFAELVGALRFLTRLPVPFARTAGMLPLAQSARAFAVAGALIGALQGAAFAGFMAAHMDALLAGALAIGLGLLITGALHEDGLADTADGFGGGKDKSSRLAIMRDSRIGSYGTLALIIGVSARVFALRSLQFVELWPLIAITAAAGAFSRAMMVDLMWSTRPARSEGLSAMAGRPSRRATLFAIISGIACAGLAGIMAGPEAALIAVTAATLVTAGIRHMAIKLIDGQTGDVCGAAQVLAEIAMLSAFASLHS